MVTRSGWLKIGGAVVAVVLVVGIAGAVAVATTFEAPTVEESTYRWGEVTDSSTEIVTEVTVTNPNPVGIPGIVDIGYTATLNDVTLAEGQESGVGFASGTSSIELVTEMQNDRIADWWVTHVNGGEQSTMKIEAAVSAPGFSRTIPAREQTIETDILGGFSREERRTVTVQNSSFLEISDQQATWGEADADSSPIVFTSSLRNVHDYDITLDGVEYVVTMNGVTLGQKQVTKTVDVAPGEQGSLDVTVGLNTPKMADWWAEHVRDDERSNLSIAMYGIVEDDGERTRVPIRLFDETLRLETDMLGDSPTNVTNVDTQRAQEFTWPSVTETNRQWGAVTDATTEIESTTTIDTPSDEMADLLTLDIAQETTINGITVASSSQRVSDLSPGSDRLDSTVALDNSKVSDWWARHLNQGERSTFATDPSATVDVGFTRFDVDMAPRNSSFTTDLLTGMNGQTSEEVTIVRDRGLVFERVDSEWGTATPQTAPLNVEATVENELPTRVEISEVDYQVTLGGVVLADKTTRNVDTLAPGATDTLSLTMELDNQQMDEWWVSHVRNDEQSQLDVSVEVTAESTAGTATREIDSLGQSRPIQTDILGQADE